MNTASAIMWLTSQCTLQRRFLIPRGVDWFDRRKFPQWVNDWNLQCTPVTAAKDLLGEQKKSKTFTTTKMLLLYFFAAFHICASVILRWWCPYSRTLPMPNALTCSASPRAHAINKWRESVATATITWILTPQLIEKHCKILFQRTHESHEVFGDLSQSDYFHRCRIR